MVQQTQRMADLLEGMLTMTRLDSQHSLELQPVDLNQLVQQIYLEMQSAASPKGVTPILNLTAEVITVTANPVELKRALVEIMKNAIQFTPEGGTVTLRTNHRAEAATVDIEDTGVGIADTDLPYIFDRLYRGDKARSTHSGGSGMGLAVAQKIITLHGGTLTVTSELDAGSTFQVTLPLT